ncbi:MAG: hypothetical protein ACLQJR_24205 [Stellaceae bacterium]
MSITSVTSSQASFTPPSSQQMTEFKNDFQQLAQAIQSGNLSSAQQAYATLSQFISQNPSPGGANGQSNPLTQALSQIGSALQSGNLSGAQSALTSLQQSLQSHRPSGGDGRTGDAVTSATANGSTSTSGSSGTVDLSICSPALGPVVARLERQGGEERGEVIVATVDGVRTRPQGGGSGVGGGDRRTFRLAREPMAQRRRVDADHGEANRQKQRRLVHCRLASRVPFDAAILCRSCC